MQNNNLFNKTLFALVAMAFIISAMIAWYGIFKWKQDFAYKTPISFWVFLLSGFAVIGFALLLISIKSLQAARANPVESLCSE